MKPSSEMERAHYSRIEKLRNLSYVVSLYIQYFINLTIIVAILISFWSLPYQFSSLTDVGSESLISFLKYIINIIIAMELIRVLCHQTLDTIVEIGPGKALSGFVRKTAPEIKTYAVETCADLEALSQALKG